MTPFQKIFGLDLLLPSLPEDRATRSIRWLIYLYAILWVFEGALRKWVIPGLSDVLLLVRDPVVMLIYAAALARGLFPMNKFVLAATGLTFAGFGAALALGHGNLFVALYGVRTMLIHLPLIFIVPRVMDLRHVIFLAKLTLLLTLPMTVLLALQFMSPPTAWVNRGLGGVGTAGFSGALGRYRPPGTFSFITGPSIFYPFATACLFVWILYRKRLGLLGFAAGCAILIACPISISRGLMLSCIIVAMFGIVSLLRGGIKQAKLALRLMFAGIIAVFIISSTTLFKEGSAAFSARWAVASDSDGGFQNSVIQRSLDQILHPLEIGFDAPIFGYGLGAGTNAGAKLLIGRIAFISGESEMTRLVMENGLIIGWAWILLRTFLIVYLMIEAWRSWCSMNSFPMILLSAIGMTVFLGQWAQPTQLGFGCLGAGLVLAACRIKRRTRQNGSQKVESSFSHLDSKSPDGDNYYIRTTE